MFMSKKEYDKKEQELREKLLRKLLSTRPQDVTETVDNQMEQENSWMEIDQTFSLGQDSAEGENMGLSEGMDLSGGEGNGSGAEAGCSAGEGMGQGM